MVKRPRNKGHKGNGLQLILDIPQQQSVTDLVSWLQQQISIKTQPAVCSRTDSLQVVNKKGKPLLRMEIQTDRPCCPELANAHEGIENVAKRICLYPRKKHSKTLKKLRRLLVKHYHLVPATDDPLITALKHAHIVLPEPAGLTKPIAPTQPTAVCVKIIFQQQFLELEKNEPGIRDDIDAEVLHEFRVAIRRTRTLLSQANGVLPQRTVNKYSREFSWLGASTSNARDMDVYLLFYAALMMRLPAKRQHDMTPLYDYLLRHRQQEYTQLVRTLDSARYQQLKMDWCKCIQAPLPVRSILVNAQRPTIEFASQRIGWIYRQALKRGQAITNNSPPESLHQLRKTCKKLRYMSEFFKHLYPDHKITPFIRSLKQLQNNLGEFQDCQVQELSLRQFIIGMEAETGICARTRNAISHLIENIDRNRAKVRGEFAGQFTKFSAPAKRKTYKKLFATPSMNFGLGKRQ